MKLLQHTIYLNAYMKILKPGNIRTSKCICPSCECEMEYDNRDIIKDIEHKGYLVQFGNFIECPCCSEIINVEKL